MYLKYSYFTFPYTENRKLLNTTLPSNNIEVPRSFSPQTNIEISNSHLSEGNGRWAVRRRSRLKFQRLVTITTTRAPGAPARLTLTLLVDNGRRGAARLGGERGSEREHRNQGTRTEKERQRGESCPRRGRGQ